MPFFPNKEIADLIYSYTYKKGQRVAGPKSNYSYKQFKKDYSTMQKRTQKREKITADIKKRASSMKFTDPKKFIDRLNSMLGQTNIPTSKRKVIQTGIKKLVMPAMKNLGTVKPSKTKVIKDVRGLKKK